MSAARTATFLLISAVLALGAAGCGGGEVSYDEVPGAPADVPIPNDASSLEGGGAADDAGADAEATPTPTPDPETGTVPPEDQSGDAGTNTAAGTDPGTAPAPDGTEAAPTDSGGATAPAEPDGPANDAAPPEGSEAQQFEDFCAENPGAC
jgi:hypothetical protein